MKLTKHTSIAKILEVVPESVQLMLDQGLHCVGCEANPNESLEQGMKLHGFNDEQVEKMINSINALHEELEKKKIKTPTEADLTTETIQEGNKTYYKIAGLMFSERAYKALHELKGDKAGLQIKLEAGGCAGYSNKYDFQSAPQEDETTYPLSDTLALYINGFTFNKLHGSIVDFETGLHGSGLKFVNPNIKGACHCGTSVAL